MKCNCRQIYQSITDYIYTLVPAAGVWADKAYTRRMTEVGGGLQGATAGAGELHGVREGLGEGVTGFAPPNPEQLGEVGNRAVGQRRRWGQQSQGVHDSVFGEGRDKALPS